MKKNIHILLIGCLLITYPKISLSINEKLLDFYVDDFSEYISMKREDFLTVNKISEDLDFLSKEDEDKVQQYLKKKISFQPSEALNDKTPFISSFKHFMENCQEVYALFEYLDAPAQAAVTMLFEKVQEKLIKSYNDRCAYRAMMFGDSDNTKKTDRQQLKNQEPTFLIKRPGSNYTTPSSKVKPIEANKLVEVNF